MLSPSGPSAAFLPHKCALCDSTKVPGCIAIRFTPKKTTFTQ